MREIEGISGWQMVTPFMGQMPEEMIQTAQKCESPIEQLFTTALFLVILTIPQRSRPKLDVQVPIGPYRADIVLSWPNGLRVVIECDGAEFHKDKAKDDKRTKVIERHGYWVERLSGSEIHHNPVAYAKGMLDYMVLLPPLSQRPSSHAA